jgi:SAM-dependent methyltransferase
MHPLIEKPLKHAAGNMKKTGPCAHSNRTPYNWLLYEISHQFLVKFSGFIKGTLYDLGCGEMPYREWLLGYADRYIGVDWSNSPHDLKADIVANLNEALPIENQVADSVISLSVMEHLREPQFFLSEAHRILKPGGAIILQVPFMWWVHEAPHDYFRYTKYGLEYMFEKAGFSKIKVHPQTGFWTTWILKLNYQSSRLIRGPWPIRKLTSFLMRAIWAVDQRIAPWLDKRWPCEEETAGYFVVALKP